jgi:pimeloyl-ACP methyl ester carboxylesterase
MLRLLAFFLAFTGQASICSAQVVSQAATKANNEEWVTFTAERVATTCAEPCRRHAVIFVHGIFGSRETWLNPDTSAYFPQLLARDPRFDKVDIYRADYENYMMKAGPSMKDVLESLTRGMIKIHERQYETTQFVAHSLGGLVVRRYLLHVKSKYGHKTLSLYRQAILLGTPIDGSYFSSIGQIASSNQLLRVLNPINKNDFLQMLNASIDDMSKKHHQTFCPSLRFYAGYETKATFLDKIVSPESAASSIECSVALPQSQARECIRGFDKTHAGLAKPTGITDPVYDWVSLLILDCVEGRTCRLGGMNSSCGSMEPWTKGSPLKW